VIGLSLEQDSCKLLNYFSHLTRHSRHLLYREICECDPEGIVAKRKDSVYSSTGQWLKILNPNYTQHNGTHEKFTAFKERSGRVSRREMT
jgi:hypothetical protein